MPVRSHRAGTSYFLKIGRHADRVSSAPFPRRGEDRRFDPPAVETLWFQATAVRAGDGKDRDFKGDPTAE